MARCDHSRGCFSSEEINQILADELQHDCYNSGSLGFTEGCCSRDTERLAKSPSDLEKRVVRGESSASHSKPDKPLTYNRPLSPSFWSLANSPSLDSRPPNTQTTSGPISSGTQTRSKILLASSGLDSYIASRLYPDYWPVYIDIFQKYRIRELERMDLLYGEASWDHVEGAALGLTEREDGFIRQRNTYFITLAQGLFDADKIMLCAVKGEYSRDKHQKFFRQISSLLSYTADKPVKVFTPFAESTKAQVVSLYFKTFKTGIDAVRLLKTRSCYSEEATFHCGQCMSCFRRWVALECNGIHEERWDTPPWEWFKKNRPVLKALLKLPISEWPKFARAQADVLKAYRNLTNQR